MKEIEKLQAAAVAAGFAAHPEWLEPLPQAYLDSCPPAILELLERAGSDGNLSGQLRSMADAVFLPPYLQRLLMLLAERLDASHQDWLEGQVIL